MKCYGLYDCPEEIKFLLNVPEEFVKEYGLIEVPIEDTQIFYDITGEINNLALQAVLFAKDGYIIITADKAIKKISYGGQEVLSVMEDDNGLRKALSIQGFITVSGELLESIPTGGIEPYHDVFHKMADTPYLTRKRRLILLTKSLVREFQEVVNQLSTDEIEKYVTDCLFEVDYDFDEIYDGVERIPPLRSVNPDDFLVHGSMLEAMEETHQYGEEIERYRQNKGIGASVAPSETLAKNTDLESALLKEATDVVMDWSRGLLSKDYAKEASSKLIGSTNQVLSSLGGDLLTASDKCKKEKLPKMNTLKFNKYANLLGLEG